MNSRKRPKMKNKTKRNGELVTKVKLKLKLPDNTNKQMHVNNQDHISKCVPSFSPNPLLNWSMN